MFKYLCNKCRTEIDEYAFFKITIEPPIRPTYTELHGTFALCRECAEKLKLFIEAGGASK